MKESFIQKLDGFFKSNNIALPALYYPIKRLPKSFVVTVISESRPLLSNISRIDDFCMFGYDQNGIPFLLFTFDNGRVNIVILDKKEMYLYFGNQNFKITKFSYDSIVKASCKKIIDGKLKIDLDNALEGLPLDDKKKYTYRILDMLSKKYEIDEYSKIYETIKNDLEDEFDFLLPVIEDYALYLNEEYLMSTNQKKSNDKVVYYEPNETINLNTSKTKKNPNKTTRSYERRNEIIPIEDRIKVLSSFGYVDYVKAISRTNDEDYYCYLFPMGNDEYILICEPVNGSSYTKIYHINARGIEKDNIIDYAVSKYLPLNDKETLSSSYAYRLSHTSLKTYENSISYAITLDGKKYKIRPYVAKSALGTIPDTLQEEDLNNHFERN